MAARRRVGGEIEDDVSPLPHHQRVSQLEKYTAEQEALQNKNAAADVRAFIHPPPFSIFWGNGLAEGPGPVAVRVCGV